MAAKVIGMQETLDTQADSLIDTASVDDPVLEDEAMNAWLRAAVAREDLGIDAMAQAMQSDGYDKHDAHLLAALGVLRHTNAPLSSVFANPRLQNAIWHLIAHFRVAKRKNLEQHIKKAHVPLSPSEVRDARVRLTCHSPELALFDGVLSSDECNGLIDLARNHLSVNRISSDMGDTVDMKYRSSSGCFLTEDSHALIGEIRSRIATLVRWPPECMEDMAIVRYAPGEQFVPHHDYFNDQEMLRHREEGDLAGQRIGTFLLYLSDVAKGGSTNFGMADMDIVPKRGSAVYFTYRLPDGSMDEGSLHGGAPVLEGEKWIATIWLREKPLRQPATP